MSGEEALAAMIAKLRSLGQPRMAERVAELAAPLVEAELKATAAAGTTPEGQGWQPKKSGGRPLEHAADAITVSPQGRRVYVVLKGPTVFHHKGIGHAPVRQVIPDAVSVPDRVWSAMRKACELAWAEVMKKR